MIVLVARMYIYTVIPTPTFFVFWHSHLCSHNAYKSYLLLHMYAGLVKACSHIALLLKHIITINTHEAALAILLLTTCPDMQTGPVLDEHTHNKSSVIYTSMKNIFQKCKGMYVGMAVPKTTAARCRDGSVQARHVIQRLHK